MADRKRGRILVIKNDGQSDLAPPDKNGSARSSADSLDIMHYLESLRGQFTAAISMLAQNVTELEARVTLLTEKINDRD